MAYGDFKDLTRRKASDKILCDKIFHIATNSMEFVSNGLASIIYTF